MLVEVQAYNIQKRMLTEEKRAPQQYILDELARRRSRNPRYSLRAFARSLGISHSVLSLFLNGKRTLSQSMVQKLAGNLSLTDESRRGFMEDCERLRSKNSKGWHSINLDTFNLISSWHHYAILSLMETNDARFEAEWIAKRLGIRVHDAQTAMETLLRLGFVVKEANGKCHQATAPLRIDNKHISTEVTRMAHKQMMHKAGEVLDKTPPHVRDFSSVTMAVDPQWVGWAHERIKQFRRSLMNDLESKGKPSEVYNLSVQFFPLTRIEDETL